MVRNAVRNKNRANVLNAGISLLVVIVWLSSACLQAHATERRDNARTPDRQLAQSSSTKQQIAGVVMQVSGQWNCDSATKSLKVGDPIADGGKLERLSKEGTITLVLVDGRKLTFSESQNQNGPIVIRKTKLQNRNWLQLALEMFSRRPGDWIVAESRNLSFDDREDLKLSDAIVTSEAGQIDVGPAIQRAANGRYTFEVRGLGRANGNAHTETVVVQRGSPLTIQESEMPVGLYKLRLTPTGKSTGSGEALVLVCSSADFESKRELYRKAAMESAQLKDSLTALELKQLLRAYMGYLNEPSSRATTY